MKKIILLALTALIMVGCVEHYKETKINSDYSVRVIDSCEYIVLSGVGVKAHKGNCRFCEERRQKELKELVTKLKEE
jgi:uncharacterized protein YcfL